VLNHLVLQLVPWSLEHASPQIAVGCAVSCRTAAPGQRGEAEVGQKLHGDRQVVRQGR
jgi:hypothetical protein